MMPALEEAQPVLTDAGDANRAGAAPRSVLPPASHLLRSSKAKSLMRSLFAVMRPGQQGPQTHG
jgi:hypothetical protein